MLRGFRVGRAFGIPLVVDLSWLVSLAVITLVARELWVPVVGLGATGLSLLFGVVFFSTVVAHELAHALAARALGIPTADITLFIFGGVARIASEPDEAADEALVAVAGPLVSITLAGVLLLASLPARGATATMLGLLGTANLTVGVFNLLPGFPLDGGRVARALLWRLTGRRLLATRVTAWLGRALALVLVAVGLSATLVLRDPRYLLEVVLGWFLWRAAGAGEDVARHLDLLRTRTVGDYMTPWAGAPGAPGGVGGSGSDPSMPAWLRGVAPPSARALPGARQAALATVPAWASVADLAAQGRTPVNGGRVVVLGGDDRPLGRLSGEHLARAGLLRWPGLTAGAAVEPLDPRWIARTTDRADRFFNRYLVAAAGGPHSHRRRDTGRTGTPGPAGPAEYLVLDADGRLAGVVDGPAGERLRTTPPPPRPAPAG